MKLAFKFDSGKVISHEVFERTFTIGRSDSCRISLDTEGFSREHALFELIDTTLYLTDLDSKNGIYINHIRLPKRMRVAYDPKFPLYIGDCYVTVDYSKDLQESDHLSLVTHDKISPHEIYQNSQPAPKRAPTRPKPVPVKKEKRFLDGKGVLITLLILVAFFAITANRDLFLPRDMTTGQEK